MRRAVAALVIPLLAVTLMGAGSEPVRGRRGMVASQKMLASEAGLGVLGDGGTAVDAAVATAFALAVTLPRAGNIGGGGFMVFRPRAGEPVAYDFREVAPAAASADMWLVDGVYSRELHHASGRAVGIPGTVAGLHMAWEDQGRLPWRRLVEPAIRLARDGIVVTDDLERSLQQMLPGWKDYPGTVATFTKDGQPYIAGEIFRQPDFAESLERIAAHGPAGFYEGETARLFVDEMQRVDGIITLDDLRSYRAKRRTPIRGTYRGYDIVSMPPPSSGGVALVQMLNMLEPEDLAASGFQSADTLHVLAETIRRAFADRARYLGDADFNPDMPTERLASVGYAMELRRTIDRDRASVSSPSTFEWPAESLETTHFSVVDEDRNAVSVTYTIERPNMAVTDAGFLLNSELGDFNAEPGVTTESGLIGTPPNLAAPGKRPLSSMSPTIVAKDGRLFMVTGSPGGRTIINTVLQTIINAIDYGMNAQEVIDAGRLHHQWLPDRIQHEQGTFSADTLSMLRERGHALAATAAIGAAQVIIYRADDDILEGGSDRRRLDGGVAAR